SKRKCRVLLSTPESIMNPGVAEQWRELDRPSRVGKSDLLSRPGVFAWDRVDPGSRLLSEHLPADLQGDAADLGAGYGYLSAQLLRRCPGLRAVDLYEADQRALDLARQNLGEVAGAAALDFYWHDVCAGLPKKYDCIVSNPPFHAHTGEDRPDLGRTFLRQAGIALRPGGRLLLVANRHLPYEATLSKGFSKVRQMAQAQGFKVIEAIRGAGDV
ncbi:MAG: methyltransferase, partial [Xanthomonadales bacterium]|nr:methyltransferase [Xanthomonadales bacterium]